MLRLLLSLASACALAAVAACTPTQPVEVSEKTSASPNAPLAGQTIAVVQSGNASGPSKDFSAELAQRLTAAGYRIAPPDAVTLFATLNYDVGDPETRVSEIDVPIYETVERFEVLNGRNVIIYEDEFAGYRTERYEETVYQAVAEVRIHRGRPEGDGSEPVYEGRVHTEGPCGRIEALIGPLLDALFEDMSASGETIHRHSIRVEGC